MKQVFLKRPALAILEGLFGYKLIPLGEESVGAYYNIGEMKTKSRWFLLTTRMKPLAFIVF